MPKIRKIIIKNFRSIRELELDPSDLTVIVGDNDCGKSNILRALNLFFNGNTNPNTKFNFADDYNRYVQAAAKTAPQIEVTLYLEIPESYRKNNGDLICWRKRWRTEGLQEEFDYWGIRLEKKKRGSGFKHVTMEIPPRSKIYSLLNRIQFEYVPAIRSSEFFRELRGRIFQVIAKASERSVRESSGQLEGVISDAVSALINDINSELLDESTLSLPNDLTPLFESLDFLSGEKLISLENRGDGIKARYIPLILKFIAEKGREGGGILPTFIWAYEEPENNLEFRRAQELADAFKKLAHDDLSQVILTTHSPIFYNMHSQENSGICSAFHLAHEGPNGGTKARSAIEAQISLDESMGAMAIIAPHIKAAQEDLSEAIAQAEDLKNKLAEHNPDNLPTLFVEGATDYLLFTTLLQRFRNEQENQMFVAEPSARAGANYVTNMLRSWEFRIKHLALDSRTKAVGIVDADPEGLGALDRFTKETNNWSYVEAIKLQTPAHLVPAYETGLHIPITLEELWPLEIWQVAAEQNWLVNRKKDGLQSAEFITLLTEQDVKPSNLIGEEWQIFYEQRADPTVENRSKTNWVNHMIGLPDDRLADLSVEHLSVLDKAIACLDV